MSKSGVSEPTAEVLREAVLAHVRHCLTELLERLAVAHIPPDYHKTLMDADRLLDTVIGL